MIAAIRVEVLENMTVGGGLAVLGLCVVAIFVFVWIKEDL